MYTNGIIKYEFAITIAPDGKSMLLGKKGKDETLSIQVVSLKAKELMLKMPFQYENDVIIFRLK